MRVRWKRAAQGVKEKEAGVLYNNKNNLVQMHLDFQASIFTYILVSKYFVLAGQYIIADRYNHRIQVLDPSGRFLRAFGSQGTADGKFNYPWGVTTDALGFIYVSDKENHRVQVWLDANILYEH